MRALRFFPFLFLVGMLVSFLPASQAAAAPFTLIHTLNNPTPGTMDRFGYSIAVSGNRVFAGAVFDTNGGISGAGRSYVFDAPSGTLQRAINNPRRFNGGSGGDFFGVSLDLDGNLGVIGAHHEDIDGLNAGTAYLYDVDTGVRLADFRTPEGSSGDQFGVASAISGDNVVIGVVDGDVGGSNVGSAYLFDALSGSLQFTLANPNPTGGDDFGFKADIDGNIVAVSAELEDTGASNAGAVYLYDATSGLHTQSLFNPNPGTGDVFGQSINLFDERLIVGAPGDDTLGTDTGTAYLYDALTGSIIHTFTNPNGVAGDFFGSHVAMNENFIVITAAGDDTAGLGAGAAYVYDAITFNLLQTILNPFPSDTGFGGGGGDSKISLGDSWLAISNANGNDSGTVFLYAAANVPSGNALSLLALGLTVMVFGHRASRGRLAT